MSDGHPSHRRNMIAAGAFSVALHTRHRGVAPLGRRGRLGLLSPDACGATPLRNRDGLRLCRPPGARASAQLSAKCIRALVIPT